MKPNQIAELLKLISNDPVNSAIPWNEFSSISEKKFGKSITKDSNWETILFLRSLIGGLGLVLNPKEMTVVDTNPVIDFARRGNYLFKTLVQRGVSLFQHGDWRSALLLFEKAQSFGVVFDLSMCQLYFYLGLIEDNYLHSPTEAALCITRGLIILERYSDEQDPQVILMYYQLAQMQAIIGNKNLAMALSMRAALLAQGLFPEHPWSVLALSSAAEIAANLDKNIAMVFVQFAANKAKYVQFTEMQANLYNKLGIISLACEQVKEAEKYVLLAIQLVDKPEFQKNLTAIRAELNNHQAKPK